MRPLCDATLPKGELPAGTFVQTCDYISIEAEHFVQSVASNGAELTAGTIGATGKVAAGAGGSEQSKGAGKADSTSAVAAFKVLPGYGKTLSAIKVFPVTAWFPTSAQTGSVGNSAKDGALAGNSPAAAQTVKTATAADSGSAPFVEYAFALDEGKAFPTASLLCDRKVHRR